MLGLALHGTPARYVRAVDDAARGCAGIILQFPLYAGIMGMMHQSGLTAQIAAGLSAQASATTLPLYTFASAGVVNLFIPSGGGQWGVQGPIAVQAALEAGVEPAKMVMAVAYGDQLTNMLQPFWALPLLAITGVRARDIVGYTAVLMILAGLWLAGCLLLF
jgi:short-chain fatty acids transporter